MSFFRNIWFWYTHGRPVTRIWIPLLVVVCGLVIVLSTHHAGKPQQTDVAAPSQQSTPANQNGSQLASQSDNANAVTGNGGFGDSSAPSSGGTSTTAAVGAGGSTDDSTSTTSDAGSTSGSSTSDQQVTPPDVVAAGKFLDGKAQTYETCASKPHTDFRTCTEDDSTLHMNFVQDHTDQWTMSTTSSSGKTVVIVHYPPDPDCHLYTGDDDCDSW